MRGYMLAGVLLLSPAQALGQEPGESFQYKASAYGKVSAGACQHGHAFMNGGGGFEGFVWKGLSAGASFAATRFVDRAENWGMATADVGWHFVNRRRFVPWDPFVTAGVLGYSYWQNGSAAGSVGGGVNYWLTRHIALRFEGRSYGMHGELITVFQVGAAFR